ncbi:MULTISPECIES: hypothetical protein [unclassified Nostoc]|uniref:WD40 repeat domain-containing protein n=1 Tax=unclassified Nostoc TaxID=2593658 RepID=UPI002AD1D782|nr:hypothetical protein [Nostoc sp. DedQUE03]MDZ7971776.1 hypothetical protein [Nostoc sp. DedQUE03]MDZ8049041.1 hypothetical protein [Nostoc sp. DedQUE02]
MTQVTSKMSVRNYGDRYKTLHGNTSIVTAIAFSPDPKLLTSVSYDNNVRVWHLDTKKCVQMSTSKYLGNY